ncbi:MAG: hypothetical protein JW936_09695 [Sedimentisphaerales bacterium]|nr:hypothetical protein [Sedimentisphaerales bacterium]
MNKPTSHGIHLIDALGRFIGFVIVATVGMASVGIALLAQPVSQYYADKALVEQHTQNIEQLRLQVSQQEELLANASNPAVLERCAVANLRYLPAEAASNPMPPLDYDWPELERALSVVQTQPVAVAPLHQVEIRRWADTLAAQPQRQIFLLLAGAALVLVALACFSRRPQ